MNSIVTYGFIDSVYKLPILGFSVGGVSIPLAPAIDIELTVSVKRSLAFSCGITRTVSFEVKT